MVELRLCYGFLFFMIGRLTDSDGYDLLFPHMTLFRSRPGCCPLPCRRGCCRPAGDACANRATCATREPRGWRLPSLPRVQRESNLGYLEPGRLQIGRAHV